jgi:hypothetical protein
VESICKEIFKYRDQLAEVPTHKNAVVAALSAFMNCTASQKYAPDSMNKVRDEAALYLLR